VARDWVLSLYPRVRVSVHSAGCTEIHIKHRSKTTYNLLRKNLSLAHNIKVYSTEKHDFHILLLNFDKNFEERKEQYHDTG
jgi:hypothetical protein